MNIIFDNIIFDLQKLGGISVYWYELVKRFNCQNNENLVFIDSINKNNIYRRQLDIDNSKIIKEKKYFQYIKSN